MNDSITLSISLSLSFSQTHFLCFYINHSATFKRFSLSLCFFISLSILICIDPFPIKYPPSFYLSFSVSLPYSPTVTPSLSLSLSISPSLFLAHTYSQWHGPCLSVCLSHYLFSFLKFGLSFPVKILGSTVYSSFSQSHSHLRPLNV